MTGFAIYGDNVAMESLSHLILALLHAGNLAGQVRTIILLHGSYDPYRRASAFTPRSAPMLSNGQVSSEREPHHR